MQRIYFDYNATTPLAPEVVAAVRPFLDEAYGNPSSQHWAGERARAAIDRSRQQVAAFLNCQPAEVVFTSGGTESNNSALGGVFFANERKKPAHFIISSVEHPSIYTMARFLERLGAALAVVGASVDVSALAALDHRDYGLYL